ncbi:hypothetical protein A2U01_0013422, partial [Trifolium medium]|nr:hypothetical protein [Trifolium medium]
RRLSMERCNRQDMSSCAIVISLAEIWKLLVSSCHLYTKVANVSISRNAPADPRMGYGKAYADAETPSPPAQAEPYASQHPPLAPFSPPLVVVPLLPKAQA